MTKTFGQLIKPHFHPKKNDEGELVRIYTPSKSSEHTDFHGEDKHVTIVPGDKTPAHLNNIPFKKWNPEHSDWNKVEGQGDFREPELHNPEGHRVSTGVIIHEPDGRIWTHSPTNGFGGYHTAIGPKGRLEKHLNPRANAIKEAHEETGLKVKLIGHAADVKKSTGITRYYHGARTGGHPGDMGWESQAVHLVPKHKLVDHLNTEVDKSVARHILK